MRVTSSSIRVSINEDCTAHLRPQPPKPYHSPRRIVLASHSAPQSTYTQISPQWLNIFLKVFDRTTLSRASHRQKVCISTASRPNFGQTAVSISHQELSYPNNIMTTNLHVLFLLAILHWTSALNLPFPLLTRQAPKVTDDSQLKGIEWFYARSECHPAQLADLRRAFMDVTDLAVASLPLPAGDERSFMDFFGVGYEGVSGSLDSRCVHC
jgi:hypothetical protein